MDPTQCYLEMIAAFEGGDFATARDKAVSLRGWLDKGGFYPRDVPEETVSATLFHVLALTARSG